MNGVMSKWSDSDIIIGTQKSVPMSDQIEMGISSLDDISFPCYREQKYSLDAKLSHTSLWLSHIPTPWLTIKQLHENSQTLGHFFEPLYVLISELKEMDFKLGEIAAMQAAMKRWCK